MDLTARRPIELPLVSEICSPMPGLDQGLAMIPAPEIGDPARHSLPPRPTA